MKTPDFKKLNDLIDSLFVEPFDDLLDTSDANLRKNILLLHSVEALSLPSNKI